MYQPVLNPVEPSKKTFSMEPLLSTEGGIRSDHTPPPLTASLCPRCLMSRTYRSWDLRPCAWFQRVWVCTALLVAMMSNAFYVDSGRSWRIRPRGATRNGWRIIIIIGRPHRRRYQLVRSTCQGEDPVGMCLFSFCLDLVLASCFKVTQSDDIE